MIMWEKKLWRFQLGKMIMIQFLLLSNCYEYYEIDIDKNYYVFLIYGEVDLVILKFVLEIKNEREKIVRFLRIFFIFQIDERNILL